MRPLHWMGSAKKDYLSFPAEVQDEMGYALGLAQLGAKHPNAKPWKGEGPGILEIVEDHRGDTYRAVYAVRFADVARAIDLMRTSGIDKVGLITANLEAGK